MLAKFLAVLLLSAGRVVVAGAQQNLVEAATGLFERRKFDQAEPLLRQALSRSPTDVSALVLLGRLRATVGHVGEAEVLYKKAIEASPGDASAHHALAKVFTFQQRWAEAKASFEQSLRLDADNAEAWLGRGRVSMTMGEEGAAAEYYKRSLDLDPANALVHFDLGVLSCKQGQIQAADEAFAKAAELNPRLDLTVVAQMFTAYNMLDQARDTYKRILEKDPNNPTNMLAYGELCEALKDEEEAMTAYDNALIENPGMGKAHLRKGLLLTGSGLTNLAALHACGLNAAEARRHLAEAARSGEEGIAASASEALAWCDMEERQVAEWHRVVKEELSPVENRKTAPESNEHIGGNSRRTRGEASTSGVQEATGEAGESVGGDAGARFSWVQEVGGFLSLPEVEVFDGDEFAAAFVNRSRPAVIKNFQAGFAAKEAWSWEALSDRFGDSVVRVSLSETGRFDGPEPGELWGLAPDDEVLVRPPGTSMAFSDFVRLSRAKGLRETFYLEYLAVHQYLGKLVQDMIPLPDAAAQSGLELLLTNLWIGKGGTTAVLHYDDYENLLCQIRGTKELIIFPPKDLKNLYYVGRRKGKLEYEYPSKWRRGEMDGSNKVIFGSSVFLDDPDFARHPRLKRCRPYRVVLREGDVLYMPAFWHHEVRSYPDEDEGNVAVNFWFRNVTSFAEEERDVLGVVDTGHSEL